MGRQTGRQAGRQGLSLGTLKLLPREDGPKDCTRCKGVGIYTSEGFRMADGSWYPTLNRECHSCGGAGTFQGPSFEVILSQLLVKDGSRVKASLSSSECLRLDGFKGRLAPGSWVRTYYVWRWYRFHAGTDVTLPMTAESLLGGDPYRALLESFAGQLAFWVTGHRSSGVARWAPLLGNTVPDTSGMPDTIGMPDTSRANGPVVDGVKPWEEALELR